MAVNLKLNPKNPAVWITVVVLTVMCAVQFITYKVPTFDAVNRVEWMTYDWRVRQALAYNPPVVTNLGFAAMDDTSLKEINAAYGFFWPWPRQMYGRVIKELDDQGAKIVGFDILFPELHPTNDATAYKLPDGTLIQSDDYLVQQLELRTNTVLAAGEGLLPADKFLASSIVGDISSIKDSDGILRRIFPFKNYTNWNAELRQATRLADLDLTRAKIQPGRIVFYNTDGTLVMVPDSTNVFEIALDDQGRLNMADLVEGTLEPGKEKQPPYSVVRVWHMGFILAAKEMGADLEKSEIVDGKLIINGNNGPLQTIPLERDGSMYVNWSIPINAEHLYIQPVERILASEKLRSAGETNLPAPWKGRVIVVGSTATGNNITDMGATPFDRNTYLVSKHWNIVNSIITGTFITKSTYAVEFILILLLGIVASTLTWQLKPPWATIWVVVIGGVYVLVSLAIFIQFRYWVPVVLPLIGSLVMNHVAQVSYQVIVEQKEKRRVKGVFAKLVSPNVVNELLNAKDLSLGGTRRFITVFFADVRGFTQMTDMAQRRADEYISEHKLEGQAAETYRDEVARETLSTVNIYLATIADQIKKHDGTLDKYIGDCVMAFWGAPTSNDKHADACVRASIDSQRAMFELNQTRLEENRRRTEENVMRQLTGLTPLEMLPLLSLGTGINSGTAVVGLMGSEGHIVNYTVFGRDVNLASRLEGVSGRGRIIIGETTFNELVRTGSDLAKIAVEQPPTQVKGITGAVRNWEVPWRLDKDKLPSNVKQLDADSTAFTTRVKPVGDDATTFIPKDKANQSKPIEEDSTTFIPKGGTSFIPKPEAPKSPSTPVPPPPPREVIDPFNPKPPKHL